MSIQEERFAQIAAAIREKDGTTAPIRALDFAERIRAIQTGGGGCEFAVPLVVTVDAGATVTATHGETTVTATSGPDGSATLILTAPGVWGVTATLGDKEKSTEVEVLEGYTAEFMLSSRLPVGYTELEYIQFDNKCGINTLINPAFNKTRVVMTLSLAETLTQNTGLFFNVTAIQIAGAYRWFYAHITKENKITYADFTHTSIEKDMPFGTDKKTLDYNTYNGVFVIDGVSYPLATSNATNTNYLYIGGSSNTNSSVGCKFYSVKIYDGNDEMRDFVPCENSNGKAGFYDIIGEKFYTNAWSGTITPGPAV